MKELSNYLMLITIFGLRGGEHRKICVNNFSLGPNVINCEENVCKTFHGGTYY